MEEDHCPGNDPAASVIKATSELEILPGHEEGCLPRVTGLEAQRFSIEALQLILTDLERRRFGPFGANANIRQKSIKTLPHIPDIGRAGGTVAFAPVTDVAGVFSGAQ